MVPGIFLVILPISIMSFRWTLALSAENPKAVNTVYNTGVGDRTTLNILIDYLKEFLSLYDPEIYRI